MSWRSGIHGYAARWGVVTAPVSRPGAPHLSRPARFERGCFTYDPARTEVWFMHRDGQIIGRGAEIGLEIWEDATGLAFAFKPPATAWSLVCGVADGRYAQCSVGCFCNDSIALSHDAVIFDSIRRATLREISITPRAACPGAICWHAGTPPESLSTVAARVVGMWTLGRNAARSAPASAS